LWTFAKHNQNNNPLLPAKTEKDRFERNNIKVAAKIEYWNSVIFELKLNDLKM
jgi:hypothetical protein